MNYANSKKQRYDKYSNGNRNNANNKNDKDRECVICKTNNHWTNACRHLSAVQAAVAQNKSPLAEVAATTKLTVATSRCPFCPVIR